MPSDRPPEVAPPTRRSRAPLGLLGAIALIVAAESAIMRHDQDLTTLVAGNWAIEGRAPARHATSNSILCFGDSMVKFGVQPRILKTVTGRKAYNFALYCGSAPASYYMLRRALDAGARPSALVVDYQPELIMGDSLAIVNRVYPELLTAAELADLCWNAQAIDRNAQLPAQMGPPRPRPSASDRFAEFGVARLLPSARKRFEIRAEVLAAVGGDTASIRDKLLAARRNWKLNHGAEVLAKNPYYQGEVPTQGAYPAMFWTPWTCRPLNAHYIDRFLDEAASRRIPVFWVLQPNAPEVDARRERAGYNAQYEAFVRDHLDRYPNLVAIDGRHVDYPPQFFTDPVHLDRDGARAYSLGIADVLQARPNLASLGASPAARWVALPDHRGTAVPVGLEDTGESLAAIKAERTTRRR